MWGTELFWTAFGAIGTTIGSLITAVVVVIALIQYRQPYLKKIRISYSTAFPIMQNGTIGEDDLICIQGSNIGVRNLNISNVYLQIGGKNLVINDLQWFDVETVNFPLVLKPEDHFEMRILRSRLVDGLKYGIVQKRISENEKIIVLVTDNSGSEYRKTTKTKVIDFIGKK